MAEYGFFISDLTLVGPDHRSSLKFAPGLNVVFGPSNTGKTFAFQCIDFMLGGGEPPKSVPESESYESVVIELGFRDDNSRFILTRSIKGGPSRLDDGHALRVLREKHAAEREDTISHFFLDLSGLAHKKIRENAQGKTRSLSFRDVSRFVLVDESSMVRETSPVLSGQYQFKTANISAFRLLLTGVDDSSVIALEDRKTATGRREGQVAILGRLIEGERNALAGLPGLYGEAELDAMLARLDAAIADASNLLEEGRQGLTLLEAKRKAELVELRRATARLDGLSDLQERFRLLHAQYLSDLHRLSSTSEAAYHLSLRSEEKCPACGADPEYQDAIRREDFDPDQLIAACQAETAKILPLISDLEQTIAQNESDIESARILATSSSRSLDSTELEIREVVSPRLSILLEGLLDLERRRDSAREEIQRRIRLK